MSASVCTVETEVLECNQRLLAAIGRGDWATYERLCDASVTSFEPEALGRLVRGLDFHHFFFRSKRAAPDSDDSSTMSDPHIRVFGDTAVLAYVRLTQRIDPDTRKPSVRTSEETRVWRRGPDGRWRMVHFHRSALAKL